MILMILMILFNSNLIPSVLILISFMNNAMHQYIFHIFFCFSVLPFFGSFVLLQLFFAALLISSIAIIKKNHLRHSSNISTKWSLYGDGIHSAGFFDLSLSKMRSNIPPNLCVDQVDR